MTAEHRRLADANRGKAKWRRWGPYLSERQWGTVREDYSYDGNAWSNFPSSKREAALTGGAKTALPASATISSACASRLRYGMNVIRI